MGLDFVDFYKGCEWCGKEGERVEVGMKVVRPKLYVRMHLIAIKRVLLLLKSRTLEVFFHIRRSYPNTKGSFGSY